MRLEIIVSMLGRYNIGMGGGEGSSIVLAGFTCMVSFLWVLDEVQHQCLCISYSKVEAICLAGSCKKEHVLH